MRHPSPGPGRSGPGPGGQAPAPDPEQWIPLAAFLIIALHSFTSPYWPEMPVLSALKEMDTVLFTSVALAVLALIRVDGEQIFCPVEAFTKGVSWPIVMAVASMAAIGGLLVADEYGIKAWLTQALGGLFSNHSPLLFVAMTVLITLVLTNFFSNTATLLVVSSLVSALSGPLVEAGYDITILAVAISLSSMVATSPTHPAVRPPSCSVRKTWTTNSSGPTVSRLCCSMRRWLFWCPRCASSFERSVSP